MSIRGTEAVPRLREHRNASASAADLASPVGSPLLELVLSSAFRDDDTSVKTNNLPTAPPLRRQMESIPVEGNGLERGKERTRLRPITQSWFPCPVIANKLSCRCESRCEKPSPRGADTGGIDSERTCQTRRDSAIRGRADRARTE